MNILTIRDKETAATLLINSFAQDPFIRWIIGDIREDLYQQKLALLISTAMDVALPMGTTILHGQKNSIAVWVPPHRVQYSLKETFKFIKMLCKITPIVRLPNVISTLLKLDSFHPSSPHYYLYFLGTHTSCQGQGLGSELLQHTLSTIDEEQKAAFLETANKKNLPLYQKFGFTIAGTLPLKNGPLLYFMTRAAVK